MAAKELKEMDNPVTRGAKAGDPMKKVDDSTSPLSLIHISEPTRPY